MELSSHIIKLLLLIDNDGNGFTTIDLLSVDIQFSEEIPVTE